MSESLVYSACRISEYPVCNRRISECLVFSCHYMSKMSQSLVCRISEYRKYILYVMSECLVYSVCRMPEYLAHFCNISEFVVHSCQSAVHENEAEHRKCSHTEQVSFRKRATNCRALLRNTISGSFAEMTYKDKGIHHMQNAPTTEHSLSGGEDAHDASGCLKLQASFRRRATNYRALSRKMTH